MGSGNSRVRLATGVLALVVSLVAVDSHAQTLDTVSEAAVAGGRTTDGAHRARDPGALSRSFANAAVHSDALVQLRARRARSGLSCRQKLLWGAGIGAAVGLCYGMMIGPRVEEDPGKLIVATTAGFGGIGFAIGFNLCR